MVVSEANSFFAVSSFVMAVDFSTDAAVFFCSLCSCVQRKFKNKFNWLKDKK